ncbi:STAS domain-containing protein [Streptomyces sp. NPDC048420]|uniref:STAS domain-containing protein n=1 Tax=Streptomyces sp. NPDC048420 TaxID=3155755 RepID=UPI00344610D6
MSSAPGLGETLVVVVVGEVDFGTSPQLGAALETAVAGGTRRVLVDLSGLSFCDCSCVNVLLAARGPAGGTARFSYVRGCRRSLSVSSS